MITGCMMENRKQNNISDAALKEILLKTRSLQYGVVSLKVHCGKIVQMEITEKTRFDDHCIGEEGGGI